MPRNPNTRFLGPEPLKPVASPVDAFSPVGVNDSKAQSLAQLGRGLAQFGGSFTDTSIKISEAAGENEAERLIKDAEVKARDLDLNRAFNQQIKEGALPAEASPYYKRRLAEAFARRLASEVYAPQLLLDVEEANIQSAEEFRTFAAKKRTEFLGKLGDDVDAQFQFITTAERSEQQVMQEVASKVRKTRQDQQIYLYQGEVDQTIDDITRSGNLLIATGDDVRIDLQAVATLQSFADDFALKTGNPQLANTILRDALLRASKFHKDADILDLAKHIKVGPANQKGERPTLERTYADAFEAARETAGDDDWKEMTRARAKEEWETTKRKEQFSKLWVAHLRNGGDIQTFLESPIDGAEEFKNDPAVLNIVNSQWQNWRAYLKTLEGDAQDKAINDLFGNLAKNTLDKGELDQSDVSGLLLFGMANKVPPADLLRLMDQVRSVAKSVGPDAESEAQFLLDAYAGKLDIASATLARASGRLSEQMFEQVLTRNASVNRGDRDGVNLRTPIIAALMNEADISLQLKYAEDIEDGDKVTLLNGYEADRAAIMTAAEEHIALLHEQHPGKTPADQAAIIRGFKDWLNSSLESRGVRSIERAKKDFDAKVQSKVLRAEQTTTKIEKKIKNQEPLTLPETVQILQEDTPKSKELVWDILTQPDKRFIDSNEDSLVELFGMGAKSSQALYDTGATAVLDPAAQATLKGLFSNRKRLIETQLTERDFAAVDQDRTEAYSRQQASIRLANIEKVLNSPMAKQYERLLVSMATATPEERNKAGMALTPQGGKNLQTGVGPGFNIPVEGDFSGVNERKTFKPLESSKDLLSAGGETDGDYYLRTLAAKFQILRTSAAAYKLAIGQTPDEVIAGAKADPKAYTSRWDWREVPYFRSESEYRARSKEVVEALGLVGSDVTDFAKAQRRAIYRVWSLGDGKIGTKAIKEE